MPEQWKETSIDNVRIGNNLLSLAITLKEDHKEYHISQSLAGWIVVVDVKDAKKVIVNNVEADLKKITGDMLKLNGKDIIIQIY
jgi:hypothetical protein